MGDRMRLVEIMTEDRVVVTRGLANKAAALDAIAALLRKEAHSGRTRRP
jgi:hypothetical protein